MPAFTECNDELNDQLTPHFQKRYEPNYAWVNAVPAGQLLPELRGLWPTSSVNENGACIDLSGQVRPLTNVNAALRGISGMCPYYDFVRASSQYLMRADEAGLDITDGLTLGGWFQFDNVGGAVMAIMAKWGAVNNYSYRLYKNAANALFFDVSLNGVAITPVQSTVTPAFSTWYFIAGRFTPQTELKIWVDNVETINLAAIPASIFNSTADFRVGADNGLLPPYMDGRAALMFLCAAAVPDVVVEMYYEYTRAMFGK